MKNKITFIILLGGAVSGYTQPAQIQFYNYGAGLRQAIYNTQSLAASTYSVTWGGYSVMEEVGSTTTKVASPSGTTVYSGPGLSGAGYSAELLAGPAGITFPGGTANGIGLVPVGTPLSTFFTSPAGMIDGTETVTLPTESYFQPLNTITIAVATWANNGPEGAATSLPQAQADGYLWGISPVMSEVAGGGSFVPPPMPDPGLESFSLGVAVPEPATIALGVFGALSLFSQVYPKARQ